MEAYTAAGAAAPDPASFTAPAAPQACPATGGLVLATSPSAARSVKSHDGAAWVFDAPAGNTAGQVVICRRRPGAPEQLGRCGSPRGRARP